MKPSLRKLPEHQERAVAVAASVHPRTVRRLIAGKPVRPAGRDRIERALREMGLGEFVGANGSTEGGQQG